MNAFDFAAIVAAGTAVVLAPIDVQPLRDLNAPEPAPAVWVPTFDEALIARVRTALGLRHWKPRPGFDETETRVSVWSQMELNDLYEKLGGTVTSRQADRSTSDGSATWTATEITLTVHVDGVGPVQIVTDIDDDPEYGCRTDIPVVLALAQA